MPQLAKKLGIVPSNVPTPVLRGIEVGSLIYFRKYLGDSVQEQALYGGLLYLVYEMALLPRLEDRRR